MFCTKCGNKVDDNAGFCPKCGAKLNGAAPAPQDAPAQPVPPVQQMQTASFPAPGSETRGPVPRRNITYRYKCPACGEVQDIRIGAPCKKCSQPAQIDFDRLGFLQIYRMGHMSGAAAGQSIYLNTVPMGHVANTGSVVIALEPGRYNVHLAIAMCRKCDDITVDIHPGEIQYYKSQMHMGFWTNSISIDPAPASSMPPINH